MVGHAPRRLIVEIKGASGAADGIAALDPLGVDAGEPPRRRQDASAEEPVT